MYLTQEEHDAFEAHNAARRAAPGVQRPHLIWDDQLAMEARAWAYKCAIERNMRHDKSVMGNKGENLFMCYGTGRKVDMKTGLWIAEKKHYDGQPISGRNIQKYAHYTQVIWPATTHVGMGSYMDRSGYQVICARYSPPGNWMGESAHGR